MLGQSGPAPLGEPLEGTGQNHARARNQIVFSQNEMGGQIVSRPALEQGRNGRAEVVEEITELAALLHVQAHRLAASAVTYPCVRGEQQMVDFPAHQIGRHIGLSNLAHKLFAEHA